MKYFIIFFISMLVFKTSISFSQEPLGLNDGFNYFTNCNQTNEYDIARTDQYGKIIWKLSINDNQQLFDSTQDFYIVFGYTFEKNGKITSDPNEYDYWLVPKNKGNEFLIYPNPNLGSFNILNLSSEQNVEFEIYDSLNRLILKNNLPNYFTVIDLINISKGFYYLKIFNNNETLKIEKICIN
jgi:hypothetical protein